MASNFSLYLLMVLLSATCCHSIDPIIKLTVNTSDAMGLVGAFEGDSLKMTCEVENLDGRVVGWMFIRERIRESTDPEKYEVTTNGSLSTLTILNLMHVQDKGRYSCGVYQNDELSDPESRETLEILVYYFPDDMYPICNGSVVITEGEPVTFRCESEPGERPVDLTWKRDSGTVQEPIRTGDQNGMSIAEYTFLPSKNDNGMTAYCIISSNAIFRGKTSNCSVGPLSVQYPPTSISLTNQNVSYSNSTYDAILCSASAFPTDISYTWSFNTFLDSSQQTLINGNQTLVILNVTLCEFPIIATCHASNDIGNSAANYTLCEPPPPPNPVCYPNNQVVLTEGVPQMFQCVSYSEDANATDVVWSRDEGLISADDITTGDLPNNYKYSNYTFVPMRDDFGINVTCSLPGGTIFLNYCVIGPLLIQHIPSDATITNGTFSYENMTYEAFSCESSAYPSDISYSWNFNTPLSASQHLLTNDNQTLVILNITTCEVLIIATCLATNDIGEYSVNVTLCEPPPLPNPVCYPNNQVVLTEGVPQMFQCVSYSDDTSATDVVWSRDEGLISADNITTGDLPNNYKYSNYTFVPMRDDFGIHVNCSLPGGKIFPNYCIIGPLLIQHIPSDATITNGTFSYENMTYEAFSCESSAFPFDISYSWNFNTPLSASQHLLTNDNQTLVILNITTCEVLIIATCLATNDIGEYSVNVTLCEPPPPPPSTTQLIMTTGTSKPITSIGPASTGLPITITDQATTTPKPLTTTFEPPTTLQPLPLTLAFYIVIIGVAVLALIALLGICYIALTPSNKDLGKMDMKETDQEMYSLNETQEFF
ncbi:uncharacterized protein LOC117289940 [Asterias rubens]|uniref:uncharacterized protein LOC117289940 n=1 Tax=Asterias rubens TaxID=7604 RepID=UPI001455AAE7|nr:uncharacterized protein LOC117289940 [Asterias rubens]